MKTEYKGFTIMQTGTTGKFVITPDATSFNLNGYATINAAKGAITKHTNANRHNQRGTQMNLKVRNYTSYKNVSIHVTEDHRYLIDDERFNPDGYATLDAAKGAITKHQEKHASDSLEANSNTQGSAASDELPTTPAVVVVPASLLKRPYQSRNQREGGYGGKTWTTATGKARHYRGGKNTTRFTLKAWAKLMRSSDAGE